VGIRDYVIQNIGFFQEEDLAFSSRQRTFEKNTVLTDYDQKEDSIYFIQSGLVITSVLYKDEERILDFHFPGSFCSSYSSLLTSKPSDIRLTCYKKCELEVVDYSELKVAYNTSLIANQLGRIATEQLFLSRVQREKELLTKTAEERYQSLMKKNPELIQEIPVKELSKYLGIRPESLSRIRRN